MTYTEIQAYFLTLDEPRRAGLNTLIRKARKLGMADSEAYDYAHRTIQTEIEERVHIVHCNEGDYKDSCKYGPIEDCPAMPAANTGATDTSLRSAAGQMAYSKMQKNDISKEPYQTIGGLKMVPNAGPYDAFYKENDMLLEQEDKGFWDYWIKLGRVYEQDKLTGWHQIVINLPERQSQPKTMHCHIVKFKDNREDFTL